MRLIHGEALEQLDKLIEEGIKIDLILADPPYGTMSGIMGSGTEYKDKGYDCSWDIKINTKQLVEKCNQVLKPGGRIILFSQQPYTTELINDFNFYKTIDGDCHSISFNQTAVWVKNSCGNKLTAKKALLNYHEDILIFTKSIDKLGEKHFKNLTNYSDKIKDFIGIELNEDYYNIAVNRIEE